MGEQFINAWHIADHSEIMMEKFCRAVNMNQINFWKNDMDRKNFLFKAVLLCGGTLLIPITSGCNNSTEPQMKSQSEISFSNIDSEFMLSNKISSASSIIKSAAIEKKSLRIEADSKVINVTSVGSKVKLQKTNGKEAYIRFGTIKTSPSIILEQSDGVIIQESSIVPTGKGAWKPEDWLAKAVLALTGALAIWLGASIVKIVAAAVAYVAINVLILSVIIAAVSILAWLLQRTGWSFDGLLDLLNNGTEWIRELLFSIKNPNNIENNEYLSFQKYM